MQSLYSKPSLYIQMRYLCNCRVKPTFAGVLADFDTIFDANSRKIAIFGGKLRTPPPAEFVATGIIAFVAFIVLGSFSLDTERSNWQEIYHKGIIDKSEYYKNRFNFF